VPSPGYEVADEERWVGEPPKRPGRTAFARDRARLVHSAGWRRLAAKTQVMIAGEGDFARTRMTHSLEVAQVGRELGASLGCDPDLVETACLAHDLGHPPFGHNGEDALADLAAGVGGFEGNAQTLRILTRLEAKAFGKPLDSPHARSVGLNLTRASLDAATKYPWPRADGQRKFGVYHDDLDVFTWFRGTVAPGARAIEAQIMDWADDVAYSVHDVEDGLEAGHIDLAALPDPIVRDELVGVAIGQYLPHADPAAVAEALDGLRALPFWPRGFDGSRRALAGLKDMTSQLIGRFSSAAEQATREAHPQERLTRHHGTLVVPEPIRLEVGVLKAVANLFVMQRRGSRTAYDRQRALIHELVNALVLTAPTDLDPPLRADWLAATDDAARLRAVIDQVASLTDHSVVSWHQRLAR
jgi:dGTPase